MSLSIVLDTSAYSMLRRGRDEVLDLVAQSSRILVPTTVLGELYAGFRLGQRFEDNRARLDEFLGEEGVELTLVDRSIAERYGQLFARLRRAGTPLPTNDIWIAACADAKGARLVTYDTDYSRIPDLELSLLTP